MKTPHKIPAGLSEQAYLKAFMEAADAPKKIQLFGQNTVIDERLFHDAKGNFKITKRGREQYVLYAANTIESPDYVYESVEPYRSQQGETLTKRRFLKTFVDAVGQHFYMVIAFTWDKARAEFIGSTAFMPVNAKGIPDLAYFEKQKVGKLIDTKK
jgi:phage-Barnase-EndoU-ColicinE5/D-RelE like nuclease2